MTRLTAVISLSWLPTAAFAHVGPAWHLHDYPALPFAVAGVAVLACAAHLLSRHRR